MKINKKWFLALGVALTVGFVGCNKDDDKDVSPEEALDVLLSKGNDRTLEYGLFGPVKSRTRTTYTSVTYTNNTIGKGSVGAQTVTEFDDAGFLTKESRTENIPTACKWAKTKYGDVIVVTARSMKVVSTDTYQHDSQHRMTEVLSDESEYTVMFGGVTIDGDELLQDTITYWNGPANTSNTTFSSTSVARKTKTATTYDDANKKATEIDSEFNAESNNWVDRYKTVYDLDQNGKIDENSSEYYYAKSASAIKFDDHYDYKNIVQYDSHRNITLDYGLNWNPDTKTNFVTNYYEYSYIYY